MSFHFMRVIWHFISSDTLCTDVWKIIDDYSSKDVCFSDLELPPSYDHLKLPKRPIEINIAFFIRQLSQVHEEKMSYDLSLSMWIGWQDDRLLGQTETAGCNPFVYRSKQPQLWIPGNTMSQGTKFPKRLPKSSDCMCFRSYFCGIKRPSLFTKAVRK